MTARIVAVDAAAEYGDRPSAGFERASMGFAVDSSGHAAHDHDAGESDLPFQPTEHGFSTIDPYRYETAVGYSEQFITEALKRSGLELTGPIHRGNWSGRPGTVTYQDLLVARRSSTT